MSEPSTTANLPPGVTLTKSVLGGFSIEVNGTYVGWIHSAPGGRWNAYLRRSSRATGHHLGCFPKATAILKIMEA